MLLSSKRRPGQPLTLGAGRCFGEAALVAPLPRLEAAAAKTSCVVLVQPRAHATRPLLVLTAPLALAVAAHPVARRPCSHTPLPRAASRRSLLGQVLLREHLAERRFRIAPALQRELVCACAHRQLLPMRAFSLFGMATLRAVAALFTPRALLPAPSPST